MSRSDLFRRIFRQFPGITLKDSREMLDLFRSAMKEGLAFGDTVELLNFGVLRVRDRKRRKARNPRRGGNVDLPPKKSGFFQAGPDSERERIES